MSDNPFEAEWSKEEELAYQQSEKEKAFAFETWWNSLTPEQQAEENLKEEAKYWQSESAAQQRESENFAFFDGMNF